MFIVGSKYTRRDIYSLLNVPEEKQQGSWNTGYTKYNNEWFVFTGIETSGRTGHNYGNHWEGDVLYWRGKSGSHISQNSIREFLSNETVVHIFTRTDNKIPFTYQGQGKVLKFEDTIPVTIFWSFSRLEDNTGEKAAGEVLDHGDYKEGAVVSVTVNAYERNKTAREQCLKYYGYKCSICDFSFKKTYGEIGEGFMHVHHLKMLSEIGKEYNIDPIKDLRPVCPNCHAMIHKRQPPFTIEEVMKLIKSNINK